MKQLPEKNKMVQPPDQVEEIVPPKYNFEDMINQALGKQEDGARKSPEKQGARSKTTRNDEEEMNESTEKNPQKVVAKKKNTENLKKRQKYDPRKAIEEAKKKQEENGNTGETASKSAFPEGFIKPGRSERQRSMTSQPKIH